MLIDTHCHLSMMIKKDFNVPLSDEQYKQVQMEVDKAKQNGVEIIINVGTNFHENIEAIEIASRIKNVYTSIGIHPNDCTNKWQEDLKKLIPLLKNKEKNKIVAIGETGIDKHRSGYNLQRQKEAFKTQIELALEYNLALIVHTRDAYDETINCLDEYKNEISRGVIHCYFYDQSFADHVIDQGFVLGLGGPLTYPKNEFLREIFTKIPLEKIVLETDAPFLPPQQIRGQQNHPREIKAIAEFLANLRNISFEEVARITSKNARKLFEII